MTTRYSVQDGVLELTLEGKFTIEEALHALAQGVAATAGLVEPVVLLDVTQSSELKSMGELRQVALGFSNHSETLGKRVAVLVVEAVCFGIARQFGVCLEEYGFESNVFRNRKEAMAWLRSG